MKILVACFAALLCATGCGRSKNTDASAASAPSGPSAEVVITATFGRPVGHALIQYDEVKAGDLRPDDQAEWTAGKAWKRPMAPSCETTTASTIVCRATKPAGSDIRFQVYIDRQNEPTTYLCATSVKDALDAGSTLTVTVDGKTVQPTLVTRSSQFPRWVVCQVGR